MMKTSGFFLSAVVVFAAQAGAKPASITVDLEQYGMPAVISWSATEASIGTEGEKTTISFTGVSSLATVTGNLHKHHERIFTAFPIAELPEAWNSCNDMKTELSLYHADGVNTSILFDDATGVTESGHLSTAPLITSNKTAKVITGGAEGFMTVMMIDANYDNGTLSFLLEGESVNTSGTLSGLTVSTECCGWAGEYGEDAQ